MLTTQPGSSDLQHPVATRPAALAGERCTNDSSRKPLLTANRFPIEPALPRGVPDDESVFIDVKGPDTRGPSFCTLCGTAVAQPAESQRPERIGGRPHQRHMAGREYRELEHRGAGRRSDRGVLAARRGVRHSGGPKRRRGRHNSLPSGGTRRCTKPGRSETRCYRTGIPRQNFCRILEIPGRQRHPVPVRVRDIEPPVNMGTMLRGEILVVSTSVGRRDADRSVGPTTGLARPRGQLPPRRRHRTLHADG